MKNLKKYEVSLKRDAEKIGLSFDHVIFKSATPDEINDIAAFGLPNRYIHWVFGAQYKSLEMMEKAQQMQIYELVLNTIPVVANLSKKNDEKENVMVMAHVLGHADIFHNNKEFVKTNKEMVAMAGEHVDVIEKYRRAHAKKNIDDYITALMTVAKASMNTFQHPIKKKSSLFYVLSDMAPKEKHEAALFDIIKQESEYFDVIFRTQYVNEGWAHFIELELLPKYFSLNDWIKYAATCSLLPPQYQIGQAIFTSIRERYGFDKCLEVRAYYDDLAFLQEYLTQELVDKLHLGVKYGEKIVTDVDVVIKEFIILKKTLDIPQIRVDGIGRNKLHLAYEETEGKKLETENRLPLYLKQVQCLWKGELDLTVYKEKKPEITYAIDKAGKIRKILLSAS